MVAAPVPEGPGFPFVGRKDREPLAGTSIWPQPWLEKNNLLNLISILCWKGMKEWL